MKLFLTSLLIVGTIAIPRRPIIRREPVAIIGGNEASQGQFPYQLSIQEISYLPPLHFCGATIIDSTTAVTAAQCVYGEKYDNPFHLEIVAGELSLSIDSGLEQKRTVTKIIVHGEYVNGHQRNNVALLKVSEPFVFNDNVSPIALANPETEFKGDPCVVSGWGAQIYYGETPDILRSFEVPILSTEQCSKYYFDEPQEDNICAGETGKYTCDYDAGGPLVCDGVLTGLVSYDHFCGKGGYPGLYAKVSYFYAWILQNL